VDRSIGTEVAVAIITASCERGAHEHPRMDDWPELIARGPAGLVPDVRHDHDLHRTRQFLGEPFVQSFTGGTRDELLSIEEFSSLTDRCSHRIDQRKGVPSTRSP
jgi:hypothetical protein